MNCSSSRSCWAVGPGGQWQLIQSRYSQINCYKNKSKKNKYNQSINQSINNDGVMLVWRYFEEDSFVVPSQNSIFWGVQIHMFIQSLV